MIAQPKTPLITVATVAVMMSLKPGKGPKR
jgi:hypothetical protein